MLTWLITQFIYTLKESFWDSYPFFFFVFCTHLSTDCYSLSFFFFFRSFQDRHVRPDQLPSLSLSLTHTHTYTPISPCKRLLWGPLQLPSLPYRSPMLKGCHLYHRKIQHAGSVKCYLIQFRARIYLAATHAMIEIGTPVVLMSCAVQPQQCMWIMLLVLALRNGALFM